MKLCVMSYYVSTLRTSMAVLLLLLDYSSGYTGGTDGSELIENNHHPPYRDLGKNVTKILHSFFAHGYDKRIRPSYGGQAVQVKVSMYIIDISSVSEVLMDFTSDFYFRQAWRDDRLSFPKLEGIEELSVGSEVAKLIWLPDTFFANEKTSYFHTATTDNTFIRIKYNGEILRSMRLTVCASCPMKLQYFPMDRQTCAIEVESYGYSTKDIFYDWTNAKAVGLDPGLRLPQFDIVGYKQKATVQTLSTGNYSRLICEVNLVRSMGYYLIQIYIPASLIVVISWVSFWLHRNATPARVQLGVLTVLTMTTLMSSTNSQLPKISYVKSIDVFLGTCFVMVFAALLEYAAVGYIGKRISMRKNRFQQLQKNAEDRRKKMLENAAANTSFPSMGQQQQHHHLMSTASPMAARYKSCEELRSMQQQQLQQLPPPIPPPPLLSSYQQQLMYQQQQHPHHHQHHSHHHSSHHHHHSSSHHQHPPSGSSAGLSQFATIRRHHVSNSDRCNPETGASCSSSGAPAAPNFPPPHPPATASSSISQQQQQQQQQSFYNPHLYRQHSMAGTQLIHRPQKQHQQQEVRLEMIGSKATTSTIAHSMSVRDLNPLSPGASGDGNSGGGGNAGGGGGDGNSNSGGGIRSRSATISQVRTGNPNQQQQQQYGSGMDRVPVPVPKNLNALFGVSPSDIDKYSRVVFPVCFICFNMMYWVIYLHISQIFDNPDLV